MRDDARKTNAYRVLSDAQWRVVLAMRSLNQTPGVSPLCEELRRLADAYNTLEHAIWRVTDDSR